MYCPLIQYYIFWYLFGLLRKRRRESLYLESLYNTCIARTFFFKYLKIQKKLYVERNNIFPTKEFNFICTTFIHQHFRCHKIETRSLMLRDIGHYGESHDVLTMTFIQIVRQVRATKRIQRKSTAALVSLHGHHSLRRSLFFIFFSPHSRIFLVYIARVAKYFPLLIA